MKDLNYIKIGAVSPELKVGDCHFNKIDIVKNLELAYSKGVEVLVFPELSITGYTCGDLFFQKLLIDESEKAVNYIIENSKDKDMLIAIGAPVIKNGKTYNAAIIINRGKILGIVPKSYLPNYNEFYEKRWFSSGKDIYDSNISYCGFDVPFGIDILFRNENNSNLIVGIEICEDLWAPIPPSSYMSIGGATLILNLSASNDLIGKSEYRKDLVLNQSARCISGYVYASAGYGESSTDLVFGGHCIISENGKLLTESERYLMKSNIIYGQLDLEIISHDRRVSSAFSDSDSGVIDYKIIDFYSKSKNNDIIRKYNSHPFVPREAEERDKRCEEIFNIQTNGLAKRIEYINSKSVIVGVSGGLDSTLALLVCVKTCDKLGLDRKMIMAITMPGFGTTDRTYNNAVGLIKSLGVTYKEISIKDACIQHFKDIGHSENSRDITYENTQARERTQILMDLANKYNGLVVGTGDLSELAMGWSTYNGDHMSMYGVNSGIPKTLVRYVVKWVSENEGMDDSKLILMDILDTPVSPELLPPDSKGKISQKTEDLIGPYELHDFFLHCTVRYGFAPKKILKVTEVAFDGIYTKDTIYKWLRQFYWRFVTQQFKRSCLPDGPKVGTICLSPRGDWRMPSDASISMWLDELDKIKENA